MVDARGGQVAPSSSCGVAVHLVSRRWTLSSLFLCACAGLGWACVRHDSPWLDREPSSTRHELAPVARTTSAPLPLGAPSSRVKGSPLTAPSAWALASPSSSVAPASSASVSNEEPAELAGVELPPDGPILMATKKEAWIYTSPSYSSAKLGYLRAGAIVRRHEQAVGSQGCEGGWYSIEPRGYVCNGTASSLSVDSNVASLTWRRPDRGAPLPYEYVMSKTPTPPMYVRLPSVAQQREVEGDWLGTGSHPVTHSIDEVLRANLDEVPAALQAGPLPALSSEPYGPALVSLGRAMPRSGFALLSRFEANGRLWGLATDLVLLPMDDVRFIKGSSFHGIELGDSSLPVAFVHSHVARFFQKDARTQTLTPGEPVAYRQAVLLTGHTQSFSGHNYLETRDGRWLQETSSILRVDPPQQWPRFALDGKSWIDVSILRQTLVAYEGTRPVYATLVSTGVDGLQDPETTHSTITGVFLIHTKHVSVTMDSDAEDDSFDLRDVPYVQYFHDGYALHAAYWHDEFGTPHSHGCVNLAPTDAAWLFGWTSPDVPPTWHGALSLRSGTTVYIHP